MVPLGGALFLAKANRLLASRDVFLCALIVAAVSLLLRGGGHGALNVLHCASNLRSPWFFFQSASRFKRCFLSPSLSRDIFSILAADRFADNSLRSFSGISFRLTLSLADLMALFNFFILSTVALAESVILGGTYATPFSSHLLRRSCSLFKNVSGYCLKMRLKTQKEAHPSSVSSK